VCDGCVVINGRVQRGRSDRKEKECDRRGGKFSKAKGIVGRQSGDSFERH
jgi:hypothetical protein